MDSDNPLLPGEPDSRPLHPSLRLEAAPYQADGGFSLPGILIVFAFTAVGAVGMGWVASWVNQWIYIIVVFPLVVGLVMAVMGAIGVYVGNVRNGLLAALAALFGGVLAMGAMHYFDHQRFLDRAREQKQAAKAELTLPQYLKQRAQEGISVRFRRIHFHLRNFWAYLYWVVEVVLAAAVGVAVMVSCAAEPFCAQCSNWKTKRVLGKLDMNPDTAVRIFTTGEVVRLADYDFRPGAGQIRLSVWECKTCGAEAPVEVKLDRVTKNAKGEDEETQLAYLTFPGQALPILDSLFAPQIGPAKVAPEEETRGQ
jgi:hypothetical protein